MNSCLNRNIKYLLLLLAGTLLVMTFSGCSDSGSGNDTVSSKQTSLANIPGSLPHRSQFSQATLVKGEALYQKNCAVCHKADASGTPEWRIRDKNGKLLPPPLNGTAHTWHHSTTVLKDVIFNGTASTGGDMPAWQGKLTEQDVDAIISWLQTKWPEEIYNIWRDIEMRSMADE